MKGGIVPTLRKALRRALAVLPRERRFALYRSFVDCDPAPSDRLQLKIAETREELEACFRLLHDAYVSSGFMKPHPSGMRVTLYHALPTTTTLCAKWDGEVVGTMSLIRDSAFGFPLQMIFDLAGVRAKEGNIAEVSALAVDPRFRKTGGAILFPLMKFMYEYCTSFFDTRHLVIAVNPNRIELYESLLFFRRLTANMVEEYDFANGAPAIGAWLDLRHAPEVFEQAYGAKPPRKNLHAYFTRTDLANILWPQRRYYTTNDPVLTPDLLDHFFNVRTDGFANLDDHKKRLLHSIYDLPEYDAVLPRLSTPTGDGRKNRRWSRYSFKCPGYLTVAGGGQQVRYTMQVIEVSKYGFQAKTEKPVPMNIWSDATIKLGWHDISTVKAMAVRDHINGAVDLYGFELGEPDLVWNKFVSALTAGKTHGDLENATRFMV
ncbi:MAG: GNAT family N-acetyltransferase [Rhodocyclaceae bacterium]|nr:GNAT family N-acetyltransferase [Rhodocyclaceae bacterium]